MTSPLCPPCSRLHELVREWAEAEKDRGPDWIGRRHMAWRALMEAAQQLPDAAAHRPDAPAEPVAWRMRDPTWSGWALSNEKPSLDQWPPGKYELQPLYAQQLRAADAHCPDMLTERKT